MGKKLSRGFIPVGIIVFISVLILTGCPADSPLTFMVTYDANGADGGAVPTDDSVYDPGQTVTVLGRNNLVRNNNAFLGWTKKADGSGTAYFEGDSLTIGSEDLVLYAKWSRIDYTSLFTEATDAGLIGVRYSSSSFADVDGDGDQDLVITGEDSGSNETATLYINDGAGSFTDADAGLAGVSYGSSSFADVDGDGDQDLVITGYDGGPLTAILYINDGAGSFTDAGAGLTGVRFSSSSFADVDGDGDQDLVITGRDFGGSVSTILYTNDGEGNFSDAAAGLKGVVAASSSFADVDGDGDQDLVITGYDDNDPITSLYTNDGEGNFTEVTSAGLIGVDSGSGNFADIEGDGDKDLVITGQDAAQTPFGVVYTNDGDGNYTDANAGLTGVRLSSSSFADVDGDNDQDLVVIGATSGNPYAATLYINDGEGNFTDANAGLSPVSSGSISIADVDGDGDLDILNTGEVPAPPEANLHLNNLY